LIVVVCKEHVTWLSYFHASLIYHISCLLQVYIIDAKRFSEEPVAKVTLPKRVPYGFHGNFSTNNLMFKSQSGSYCIS
jgi:hypothetical protein